MSYEIYYDRAFIQVGDRYVPLVNHGSNNAWECLRRRDVPEKNWNVLNWRNRSILLYSMDELRDIAADYERISQESGTCFKTRNTPFAKGEFERWIINGIRSAHTIEDYVSYGNRMFILDYSDKIEDWKEYPFATTEEFLGLIDCLAQRACLSVKFGNNRKVYRPKMHRASSRRPDLSSLLEFFVLRASYNNSTIYFARFLKSGFLYTTSSSASDTKCFRSETEAVGYLEKYKDRLTRYAFTPERVIRTEG